MKGSVLFALLMATFCAVVLSSGNMAEGFKIGAFNIQVFGRSKSNKDDVMSVLARIVRRYDIVLIQEIRDNTGKAIQKLLAEANKYSGKRHKYKMVISERLGRTGSKEQYAFLYRSAYGVNVRDTYHYDDGDEATRSDVFEREPFVVLFNIPQLAVKEIAMVAIHTDPDDAVAETAALKDVIDETKNRWKLDDVMVLGDLNADCNAFPKKYWKDFSLRQNSKYFWPIGDSIDTTTSATDCAYDRFVLTGKNLISAYVEGSGGVYRFDKAYGLDGKETKAVSDHYPIELELKLDLYRQSVSPENDDENDVTSTGCVDRFLSLFNCACVTFISRFVNSFHSGNAN